MEWSKFDNMLRQFKTDDDGMLLIKSSQNLDSFLDYTAEKRAGETIKRNDEFRHYAAIPAVVVEHIMNKYGITSMGRELQDVLLPEIEINYPYLKVTNTSERVGKVSAIIDQGNL